MSYCLRDLKPSRLNLGAFFGILLCLSAVPEVQAETLDHLLQQSSVQIHSKHEITRLSGDWIFCERQFFSGNPQSTDIDPKLCQTVKVPGIWGQELKPRFGFIAKKVQGLSEQIDYELAISAIIVPYELQIFEAGQDRPLLRSVTGQPSKISTEEVWRQRDRVFKFPAQKDRDIYVVLNISAVQWDSIFIRPPGIRLSPAPFLSRAQDRKVIEDSVFYGFFLLAALFNILIYLQRPQEKSSLFIALFSVVNSLRWASNSFIHNIYFPELSQLEARLVIDIALCSMFFLPLLNYAIFGSMFQQVKSRFIQWLAYGATLFTLYPIFSQGIIPDVLLGLVTMMYLTILLVYCVSSFRQGAWREPIKIMAVLGLVVQCMTLASDVVVLAADLDFPYIAHWGVVLFIILQSQIVGTRYVQAFRENQNLLAKITEQERARTIFFQNASHELRTPLNGILGLLGLLLKGRYGDLGADIAKRLEKIQELANSLKDLVNTILDLAKSKRGEILLQNKRASIKTLLREVEALSEGLQTRYQNSSFKLVLPPAPFSEQSEWVFDWEKLATIVRNLLSNAFKFSNLQRPNHIQLRLHIAAGDELQLEVSDTGIGIPEQQKSKIFDEFHQVSGDERRAYEGTGLGLTMVRDLVQLMGGSIQLETKLDQGSRFTIRIPKQLESHLQQTRQQGASADIIHSAAAAQDAIQPARVQGSTRILVVDDNELNCEVLQELLDGQGYLTSTALSGQEALNAIQRDPPSLILLDMMMPGMSGEDVIKAMRQNPDMESIAVVLVTARASDDDRIFGLSLGADDYIAKPFRAEEVLFRVKNILHRQELNEKIASSEARERMAQLGSIIREISHEMRNSMHADPMKAEDIKRTSETILNHLPIDEEVWPRVASKIAADETLPLSHELAADLKFKTEDQRRDYQLRYLRMALGETPVTSEEKQALWGRILQLTQAEKIECANTIRLIKDQFVLLEQNRYTSDLILSILDYSQTSGLESSCDLDAVLSRVLRLVKARLKILDIRVQQNTEPLQLLINPGQLMQVVLNLINNACDACGTLASQERWIHISTEVHSGYAVIAFENGGPPLSAEQAQQMFVEGSSSKGSKGHGLGLAISQKLLLRWQGRLDIATQKAHPCFHVQIPTQSIAKLSATA